MGMVIDFAHVSEIVKGWIDANLDHRMLLCRDDPMTPVLKAAGEPVYLMDDNPTAENIASLIWLAARDAGLQVTEVRVWETSHQPRLLPGRARCGASRRPRQRRPR